MQMFRALSALSLAASLAPAVLAHDLELGVSSTNQLVMHVLVEQPFDLPVSEFSGFPGYAAADPGFFNAPADDPNNDLFMLPPTADLEFILIASGPHIQIWNDTGSAPMQIGEHYTIGSPFFHVHPLYHSPAGIEGEIYSLQIQIIDLSGQLAASDIYTMTFTPVPEPATSTLLGTLGLGLALRLRRR